MPPTLVLPSIVDAARLGAQVTEEVRKVELGGGRRVAAAFASEDGILAPRALWLALGAIANNQPAAARGTLEALFAFQREDGQLPTRLAPPGGLRARVARACGRAPGALSHAGYLEGCVATALGLWVAAAYAVATGDRQFLQDHDPIFTRAAGCLEALPVAGLYAGALAYRATRALGELAMPRGEAITAARHWARASCLRERLNTRHWDMETTRYRDEEGAASLLAVACGLAGAEKGARVLARTQGSHGGFRALAAARLGLPLEPEAASDAEHASRLLVAKAIREGRRGFAQVGES